MTDLATRRRFFAEEIAMLVNVRTPGLVEALATVPRELFLPPGPWTIRGESDFGGPPRQTPDGDARHVYHNVAIGIDSGRQLFNGAPSVLALAIDALELRPGHRVLHVGTGLGYYTAIIAECVGRTGCVVGIEADETLATTARANLASVPWVDIEHGDGRGPFGEPFDAILINAGVTHPEPAWLDSLTPGGRLMLPLTAASPQMGPIGKGFLVLLTNGTHGTCDLRTIGFVAIYSAVGGLRDETMNAALGRALMKGPFMRATRLRRDPHEPSASCWVHGPTCCFSMS